MSNNISNTFMINNNHLRLDSVPDARGFKGNVYLNDRLYALGFRIPTEHTSVPPELRDADKQLVVYQQPEGPLVRVYWFENTWMISTSGRLNANASFWGSPVSFGAQFHKYVGDIFDSPRDFWRLLDKQRVYAFYLKPDESSRVILVPESSLGGDNLIFAGSWPLWSDDESLIDWNNPFAKIRAVEYNIGVDAEPVVALHVVDLDSHQVVKIWNKEYLHKKEIRGNDAHLDRQYCYWALTNTAKADELLAIYPERRRSLQDKLCCLMINAYLMLQTWRDKSLSWESYDWRLKKLVRITGSQQFAKLSLNDLALLTLTSINWGAIKLAPGREC